jgi:hypothetical protein
MTETPDRDQPIRKSKGPAASPMWLALASALFLVVWVWGTMPIWRKGTQDAARRLLLCWGAFALGLGAGYKLLKRRAAVWLAVLAVEAVATLGLLIYLSWRLWQIA